MTSGGFIFVDNPLASTSATTSGNPATNRSDAHYLLLHISERICKLPLYKSSKGRTRKKRVVAMPGHPIRPPPQRSEIKVISWLIYPRINCLISSA